MGKYGKAILYVIGLCWLVFTLLPSISNFIRAAIEREVMDIYYASWVISVVVFVLGLILITIFGLPKWLKEDRDRKKGIIKEPLSASDEIEALKKRIAILENKNGETKT